MPAAETVRPALRDPRISGRIVAELRAQLLDLGLWEQVRERLQARDPLGLRWIDEAMTQPWVDIETYVSVIEWMGDTLGPDRLREIGRGRVARSQRGGLFASIVRGWLRSFSDKPDEILRIVPHLWRAATRDAGRMRLAGSGEGYVRFRTANAPPAVVLTAWRVVLEGFGLGLLDLCHVSGEVQIGFAADDPTSVDFLFLWKQRSA